MLIVMVRFENSPLADISDSLVSNSYRDSRGRDYSFLRIVSTPVGYEFNFRRDNGKKKESVNLSLDQLARLERVIQEGRQTIPC